MALFTDDDYDYALQCRKCKWQSDWYNAPTNVITGETDGDSQLTCPDCKSISFKKVSRKSRK